ncbi:adhesin [Pseudoxanthomonas sp.]|uniref:adhesin n=1 Tax=Pseudoxanthomonas sp. TaxID=1871049 RepID=UPI0025848D23|nr:adhesin [Pseudoxanthomonas sp.]MCR6686111.1 adhesin [Pseudoxanthomonas sp.]
MKRNVKWTVLAVAVAAATASVANAETVEDIQVVDYDITIDDTRNYETNVTSTNTTVDDTTTVTYTDNFEWNTAINEEYNTSVNEEYNTSVSQSLDESYTLNQEVNQSLDESLTIDQTLVTHDEQVNVDSNIERDEHNVSVSLSKDLSLTSDIAFSGDPTLSGDIEIDSAAIAVVDNRQSVSGNTGLNDELTNDASIDEDTASAASGNLQFNVAAGDNNVQDNAAALSAADASFAFGLADAEVFVNQQGSGNTTANLGVANDAAIGGNAFNAASGNIGVNVTSGNNNAQKNALAASVATSAYAQASVSSNQISSGNLVGNAPKVEEAVETLEFSLTGTVSGTTSAQGSGSYAGTGNAYQQDNFYLDTWDGELPHQSGEATGHLDMDNEIQNAVDNPYRDGVGGIAFDTDEEGTLGYEELGTADLQASLTGTLDFATLEVVAAATNTASLSGSAFSGASGNIGVNVSAGTGNQQANSLSMAVAQPSTGGETPPPPTGGGEG